MTIINYISECYIKKQCLYILWIQYLSRSFCLHYNLYRSTNSIASFRVDCLYLLISSVKFLYNADLKVLSLSDSCFTLCCSRRFSSFRNTTSDPPEMVLRYFRCSSSYLVCQFLHSVRQRSYCTLDTMSCVESGIDLVEDGFCCMGWLETGYEDMYCTVVVADGKFCWIFRGGEWELNTMLGDCLWGLAWRRYTILEF